MESLIIDNAGFDINAMSKMKEAEFVKLHLENKAIAYGLPEEERVQWLKAAHKSILEAAGQSKAEPKEKNKELPQ